MRDEVGQKLGLTPDEVAQRCQDKAAVLRQGLTFSQARELREQCANTSWGPGASPPLLALRRSGWWLGPPPAPGSSAAQAFDLLLEGYAAEDEGFVLEAVGQLTECDEQEARARVAAQPVALLAGVLWETALWGWYRFRGRAPVRIRERPTGGEAS